MNNLRRYITRIVFLGALVSASDAKAQETEGFFEADYFADILTFAYISGVGVTIWCEPQLNQVFNGTGETHDQDRQSLNTGWVLREELCGGAYQCTMEWELTNILGPNPLGRGSGGVLIAVQVESAVPFEFWAEAEAHAGQSDAGNFAGLVLAIHSDWQDWFLFDSCLKQDKPAIISAQSNTNYILQFDQPSNGSAFLRMTPDAVIDPKSDPTFVEMRGLATAQGVLEPGRYTILLESISGTNNLDPAQNFGRARLRLTPITCEADINFDGIVNTEDAFRFIEQSTDLDCDEDFDFSDVSAFIAAYFSGC